MTMTYSIDLLQAAIRGDTEAEALLALYRKIFQDDSLRLAEEDAEWFGGRRFRE